ncbi:MAG: radical SAM protein [Dehalococcoidales bacterium]|nr:radical SAM protein [Dehalococcoidales bacterium]
MSKIALVSPIQSTKYSQPPLGLALLAAVLERAGYQVTVLDANALKLQPEDVVPLVSEADVVGLTAMTPTISTAIATARCLKKAYPDLPIILGGVHATLLPKETLVTAPEIDIIVRGEGEETIIELLQALEHRQPLSGIAGISYRKDDEVVSNPARSKNIDLDSLPFLAYHLLPWRSYRPHPPHGRRLPFAAIITSRGCPYRCSYCSKPIFGNKFRGQSPARVADDVSYYKSKFGIKEFAFYDDVFTLDKKRAYAIADEMIKRGLKVDWTCETRVNLVDKELLRHIKQAGCYSIAYGIESGSQEILNILDKDTTLEQAEEAVRLSQEVGLQTIGYFMIGSPGESPETIEQTIQFAKKTKLDFAQFSVTTPFPGTKLYNLYLDGRKGDNIPWESFVYASSGSGRELAPVFESSLLSRDDIKYWVKQAYREFYLRPSYAWQRIRHTTSMGDLKVSLKGLSMLLGNIRKGRG